MKNLKLIFIFLIGTSCTSCLTRAPTKYELDKQSGHIPEVDENIQSPNLFKVSGEQKYAENPTRSAPKVERAWVYDQEISGTFLQGTYVYFQMDDGQWLNPGSNLK